MSSSPLDRRHEATRQVMRWFDPQYLPPGLQWISAACSVLATQMIDVIPDNPELTVALRKLLEARDAFGRAAIATHAVGHADEH